jgi:hypothetical protein
MHVLRIQKRQLSPEVFIVEDPFKPHMKGYVGCCHA